MFLLSFGIDKDVVYEDYDEFIQEWPENPVHEVHKHRRSIGHPKRHNHILIVAILGPEGRLLHIICLH